MKTIAIAAFATLLATSALAEGVVRPVDGSAKLKIAVDCLVADQGTGKALRLVDGKPSAVAYFKLEAGGVIKTNDHHVDFTVGTLDDEGFAQRVKVCDEKARNVASE